MANNAYEDVKSFVSGPALHQSFSRIKTWTSSQISSAITTHNSNKTHVPVCSTAGTYKFLKGVANGAPTWSDIPTSSAINSNTNDTLATSAAVNALNNNLTAVSTAIADSTHTYLNRSIKFFKCNGVAMVYMDGFLDIPNASTRLCTVPSGFRPTQNFVFDQWIEGQKFRFTI